MPQSIAHVRVCKRLPHFERCSTLSFQYRADLTCANSSVCPLRLASVFWCTEPGALSTANFSRSGSLVVSTTRSNVPMVRRCLRHSGRRFHHNAPAGRFRSTFCAQHDDAFSFTLRPSCTFPVVRPSRFFSNLPMLRTGS